MKFPFTNPPRAHVSADLLSAYLDHQVTAGERARVDAHLATCAVCRAELESLRQTVALVRALPRVAVPRAFTLSEQKAGIRRPMAQPGWFGGALRGLGALAAVALVVVVSSVLLRQIGSRPAGQMAFAPAAGERQNAVVATAPVALAVEATVAVSKPGMTLPPEPTAKPQVLVEKAVEKVIQAPTAQPAADQAKPPALPPSPTLAPASMAPAAAAPKAAAPAAAEPTKAPAPAVRTLAAAPSPSPSPEPRVAATGRGGGPEQTLAPLTPESLPPTAALAIALPAKAGVAYADPNGLWALDRASGVRQIVQGEAISGPAISPDRAWIAYRVLRGGYFEQWVVRWDGKDARLLLAERELPKDDLAAGYSERRFGDVRWIPGAAALALNVTIVPTGGDLLPRFELWTVDVPSGAARLTVKLDSAGWPYFSPDGKRLAVLQTGAARTAEGSLSLYNADGSGGRVALKFARGAAPRVFATQVYWLPDGKSLWAAIPDAAADQLNGISLYRMTADGQATSAGHVDAFDAAWSPDGTRLAYTRALGGTPETRELWIANADGSNAQRYAALRDGTFINWSPDSAHFLYADAGQVYLGGINQMPRRIGNAVSVLDPRWIGPSQFVHMHDQNTGWMLVARTVDDQAASLLLLPREATYDVTQP